MTKEDESGKHIPTNKTLNVIKKSVIFLIKSLSAIPSHYSRKDSRKLYLPTEFKNIKNIYHIYKEDCKGMNLVSKKFSVKYSIPVLILGFMLLKRTNA